MRTLLSTAVLLVLSSPFAGCAGADLAAGGANEDAADGDATGDGAKSCVENIDGDCIVESGGCDLPYATETETCAVCTETEICGAPTRGRCLSLENALGEPCQRCSTEAGEVLYDDCFGEREFRRDELSCESVSREDDSGTEVCEVCRDDAGFVVSTICRPDAAYCEDTVVGGRPCEDCFTDDGDFAYRTCEDVDIDPAYCDVYGDDDGRCVACYDAADTLLSHQCTVTPGPVVAEPDVDAGLEGGGGFDDGNGAPASEICEVYSTPEGYTCEACYDAYGTLLYEECGVQTPPASCQLLFFTQQTCAVCVDDSGLEVFTECTATECVELGGAESPDDPAPGGDGDGDGADNGGDGDSDDLGDGDASDPSPPPPGEDGDGICDVPACATVYDANGTLCRDCPVIDDAGDVIETERKCLTATSLSCERYVDVVERDAPPSTDGDEATDPVYEEQDCLVCTDDGVEVYRACGNENPAPPLCSEANNSVGAACEECTDPNTGAIVYTNCADVCLETDDGAVTNAEGENLSYDNASEDGAARINAVVDCTICPGEDDVGFSEASCSLRTGCETPESAADPTLCSDLVTLKHEFTQCGETPPWLGADSYNGPGSLMLGVMAWALDAHDIPLASVHLDTSGAGQDSCTACDCPTGIRLLVEAREADAPTLIEHGSFESL